MLSMISEDRYDGIDILKAIGIIAIVLGHACNEYNFEVSAYIHYTKNVVYTFHLMIFIVCSGYLSACKNEVNIKEFLKKRIKNYYMKFVWFAYSLLFFKAIFTWLGLYDYHLIDFITQAIKILLFVNGGGVDGALWFLQLLFITSIIYIILKKIIEKANLTNVTRYILFGLIGIVGLILNNNGIIIAYRIDAAFIAIPFMELGYQMHEKKPELLKGELFQNFLLKFGVFACLSLVLVSSVYWLNIDIDIAKGKTRPILLFIAVSMLGIFWCVSLMQLIIGNKIVAKIFISIGQASAYIMAYHFMIFKLCDYFWHFNNCDSNLSLHPYSYPELRPLYVSVGVLLPTALNFLIMIVRNKHGIKKK